MQIVFKDENGGTVYPRVDNPKAVVAAMVLGKDSTDPFPPITVPQYTQLARLGLTDAVHFDVGNTIRGFMERTPDHFRRDRGMRMPVIDDAFDRHRTEITEEGGVKVPVTVVDEHPIRALAWHVVAGKRATITEGGFSLPDGTRIARAEIVYERGDCAAQMRNLCDLGFNPFDDPAKGAMKTAAYAGNDEALQFLISKGGELSEKEIKGIFDNYRSRWLANCQNAPERQRVETETRGTFHALAQNDLITHQAASDCIRSVANPHLSSFETLMSSIPPRDDVRNRGE